MLCPPLPATLDTTRGARSLSPWRCAADLGQETQPGLLGVLRRGKGRGTPERSEKARHRFNYPICRIPIVLSVLKCPTCGRGYPTRWRLKRHLVSHGSNPTAALALASIAVREPSPTRYRCTDCSRQFSSREGLSLHIRQARHGALDTQEPGPTPQFV